MMQPGIHSTEPMVSLRRRQFLKGVLTLLLPEIGFAGPLVSDFPGLSAPYAFVGNLKVTLLAKQAEHVVPIASVSKLVTALVVLSYELPLDEQIKIQTDDAVFSKNTHSHLPPGSSWTRAKLLEWLLVSSDNRAAAALARSFPGGWPEFRYAMRMLMTQMQLFSFDFGDSFGLSPINQGSARDLGILLTLLAQQPWFQGLARQKSIGGVSNVNRFAYDPSVALMAGKTGFTSAAGYCLAQAEQFGNQTIALVVLQARDKNARARDMNILRTFTRQKLQRQHTETEED